MCAGKASSLQIFRKSGNIVSRDIAGETILVPVRGKLADMQNIFSLNPVARYIWDQIDGKSTLSEVRSRIIKNFSVSAERADEDLNGFIDELQKANLIFEIS